MNRRILCKSNSSDSLQRFTVLIPLAAVVCSIVFFLVFRPDYSNPARVRNIFAFFFVLVAILISALVFISVILYKRLSKERCTTEELRNFKDFFDSLHCAPSDMEIYEVLYNFLRNLPFVDNVSLFYSTHNSHSDTVWEKFTDMEAPLCSICPDNCLVLTRSCECFVESVKSKSGCCPCQSGMYNSGSYICIPIADEGEKVKSLIQLYNRREDVFSVAELFKIKSYVEIARTMVSVRKTMSTLNKKATTDRLTKLYNRSFLDPYLENQIEAANITNQQISAIMVDMDHFKVINDSYGHMVGDYVLTIFAQLVLKCIRKTDLIARFGGDEFIVILPSTDTETAELIAERIRHEVSQTRIPPYNDIIVPPISCSVGVSTYPAFCGSKDELIMTSDLALYKAKRSGRNCIRIYEKEAVNM